MSNCCSTDKWYSRPKSSPFRCNVYA
jgi:hypothetical protein